MSPSTLPQVHGGEGGGGSAVSGDSISWWVVCWCTRPPGEAWGLEGTDWWGVGSWVCSTSIWQTGGSLAVLGKRLGNFGLDFSAKICLARLVRTTSRAVWVSPLGGEKLADFGKCRLLRLTPLTLDCAIELGGSIWDGAGVDIWRRKLWSTVRRQGWEPFLLNLGGACNRWYLWNIKMFLEQTKHEDTDRKRWLH